MFFGNPDCSGGSFFVPSDHLEARCSACVDFCDADIHSALGLKAGQNQIPSLKVQGPISIQGFPQCRGTWSYPDAAALGVYGDDDTCVQPPDGMTHLRFRAACSGASADLLAAECNAWQDLYDSTDGVNWNYCSINRLDPCGCGAVGASYGCACSNGRITAMKLFNANLKGTLPKSLGELSQLATLDLRKNKLTGLIPNLPFSQYADGSGCHLQTNGKDVPISNKFWCPLPPDTDACQPGPPTCTIPPPTSALTPAPTPFPTRNRLWWVPVCASFLCVRVFWVCRKECFGNRCARRENHADNLIAAGQLQQALEQVQQG
jgi:hypothetical protein